VGGLPKGRLFLLSRDDLLECTALLDAVRRDAMSWTALSCPNSLSTCWRSRLSPKWPIANGTSQRFTNCSATPGPAAKLTAITNGGAIPNLFDYDVELSLSLAG